MKPPQHPHGYGPRAKRGSANPHRDAQIAARRRAGQTVQQIAAAYGVSTDRIYQICERVDGN